ncbi:MAG: DUF1566 domain-containing protein [Mariniphaga sp.]|nr:DUF1566 domain-containing protein [Mariniphaga sp.]
MRKSILFISILLILATGLNAGNANLTSAFSGTDNTSITLSDCKLEVQTEDFSGSFSWHDANEKIKTIGQGWRLPTKAELDCLYKNKDKIGNFKRDWYWTSERVGQFNIWVQSFGNGRQFGYSNSNSAKIRCVRSLKK